MDLAADFEFAKEDFGSNAAVVLRYVAALNPEATRVEFVAAAVAAGYAANSSANRFRESRAFDCETYGFTQDAEGRLVESNQGE